MTSVVPSDTMDQDTNATMLDAMQTYEGRRQEILTDLMALKERLESALTEVESGAGEALSNDDGQLMSSLRNDNALCPDAHNHLSHELLDPQPQESLADTRTSGIRVLPSSHSSSHLKLKQQKPAVDSNFIQAVRKAMSEVIPEEDMKDKFEILLTDYQRMANRHNRLSVSDGGRSEVGEGDAQHGECTETMGGAYGDSLLSEIKAWTDDKKEAVIPLNRLNKTGKHFHKTARDIESHLRRIKDFHQNIAAIKNDFSKVSSHVLKQYRRLDAGGCARCGTYYGGGGAMVTDVCHLDLDEDRYTVAKFHETVEKLKLKQMPTIDVELEVHTDPDSPAAVDALFVKIETLHGLAKEQQSHLRRLFQEEDELNEKIGYAKEALTRADSLQVCYITHQKRVETLEKQWLAYQTRLFNQLYSYAEAMTNELKQHHRTETKETIIASESMKEYERLLAIQKQYQNYIARQGNKSSGSKSTDKDNNTANGLANSKAYRSTGSLYKSQLELLDNPLVKRYATDVMASFKGNQEICDQLADEFFVKIELEMKNLLAVPEMMKVMKKTADDCIDSELFKLRSKAKVNVVPCQYLIESLFKLLSKIISEFLRLTKVKRLRELQMTTLVHNIDIVSLFVADQQTKNKNFTPVALSQGYGNSSKKQTQNTTTAAINQYEKGASTATRCLGDPVTITMDSFFTSSQLHTYAYVKENTQLGMIFPERPRPRITRVDTGARRKLGKAPLHSNNSRERGGMKKTTNKLSARTGNESGLLPGTKRRDDVKEDNNSDDSLDPIASSLLGCSEDNVITLHAARHLRYNMADSCSNGYGRSKHVRFSDVSPWGWDTATELK